VNGDVLEAKAGEERREPATDEIVDALIFGPGEAALPEVAHGRAARREHGVEVGLLEQDAAARAHRRRESPEHVDALRNVVQDGPAAHQVVTLAERVAGGVELSDLEVRQRQPVEIACVDVAGDDMALGSDLPG